MIGIFFGLATGALFATGAVLARIGQRHRRDDDGLTMTILVNVTVLGLLSLTVMAPPWSTAGVLGLALGGVIGTLIGRFASLRAVRLVGATRASAFMTASPVVAAAAGWLLLGEGVEPLDALGGLIVIAGLLALVRAKATPTSMIAGEAKMADPRTKRLGFAFAAATPIAFGLGFVVKKWGLLRYDDAVLGAFIGSAAALAVVMAIDALGGRLGQRISDNFREIPWWFVASGVAMSGALLTQFVALSYLDAWLVGVLQGTQGLFAMFLGWMVLREEERIDGWVAASVLLVLAGVILIGLQR